MNNKFKSKILAIFFGLLIMPFFAFAGNISTGSNLGYAWSENAGYINFGLTSGNVTVTNNSVTGYAWDSIYGWLNLGPINIGGTSYGVINDGIGNLSGYAWSAGAGWVPFSGITINSSGKFTGITTTSSSYGKISFNCMYCNVVTSWKPTVSSNIVRTVSGSFPFYNPLEEIPIVTPVYDKLPTEKDVSLKIGDGKDLVVSKKPIEKKSGIYNVSSVLEGEKEIPSYITKGPEDKKKLFSIRFFADKNILDDSSKLITRVKFENFGKVKTTVSMLFTIEGEQGSVLYKDTASMDVENEGVYIKKYNDLSLPNGLYTVRLHTKYNENIEDDFGLNFVVKKTVAAVNVKEKFLPILITIPLLILVIFKFILERRKR